MTERCVGCNANVQAMDGPIHRYMTSAPACWQRYGALLEVLYVEPMHAATLVICADTYAVQHPGSANPQAIQSVALHLLNMYGYLVRGQRIRIPQETFSAKAFHSIAPPELRASYWLTPPSFVGSLTVFDVPLAGTASARATVARAWAESVWSAWTAQHPQIAAWYAHHARV